MPKKTALSDPTNILVVWDDEPEEEPEPETSATRRRRLRPAPKPLRRRTT